MLYAVWRICERFGLKPPGVKEDFEDNDLETTANLIAYGQLRDLEDSKMAASLAALGRFS